MPAMRLPKTVVPAAQVRKKTEGLFSLSEPEFTKQVVIPLLSELGATYITYIHGPDEDGKDLVFLMKDLDESDVLHVCQVKHTAFSGKSSSSSDYSTTLRQLEKCKRHEAVNPLTKRSQTPDRVWLISGYEIPHQSVLRAQQFIDELRREGIKVIDGSKLIELLNTKLPTLYIKYCRPTSIESRATPNINQQDEMSIFDPSLKGTVDDIFVQLDFAPPNGFFRQLVDNLLITRNPVLPRKTSSADIKFLQGFCKDASESAATNSDGERRLSPQSIVNTIEKKVGLLTQLYSDVKSVTSNDKRHGKVLTFLTEQRSFESAMTRLDRILGSSLFDSGPGMVPRRDFTLTAITPLDLLKSDAGLIIFGEPGAGKTFQAKMLFKQASRGGFQAVYFPCAAYQKTNGGLVENIVKYWARNGNHDADEIRRRMTAPDSLLILDGLDEILTREPSFLHDLGPLSASNPKLKVCLTCRSSYELDNRFEYNSVALSGFSQRQRKQFFTNWFRNDPQKASLVERFFQQFPQIQEAATSPIVATILATITQYDRELPKTYSELYAQRFELLLERWDRGKKVARNVYFREDKHAFLQDLAYANHRGKKKYFGPIDFERSFLRVLGNAFHPEHLGPFEDELLRCNGVIIQESKDVYSFGHLSYQEYLAARHIHAKSKVRVLAENFGDPWWHEVTRFYASISGDISALVRRISTARHNMMSVHGAQVAELLKMARYTSPIIVDFINDAESGIKARRPDDELALDRSKSTAKWLKILKESWVVDPKTAKSIVKVLGKEAVPELVRMLEYILAKYKNRTINKYRENMEGIIAALAMLGPDARPALGAIRTFKRRRFTPPLGEKSNSLVRYAVDRIAGDIDL